VDVDDAARMVLIAGHDPDVIIVLSADDGRVSCTIPTQGPPLVAAITLGGGKAAALTTNPIAARVISTSCS
jgi:hypothetical protein